MGSLITFFEMAAEQVKKFTYHLTCPVCYNLYKQPKYLPCYHSYCEECLVKLTVESNITCPECRKSSEVPSGGVKQLPNNFFINRLLGEVAIKQKIEGNEGTKCDHCTREDPAIFLCSDCGTFLCNFCYHYHKYSKEYQNHAIMPLDELRFVKEGITIKLKSKFALCQEHELELKFYCETCCQLVCQYCIMKSHFHHNHDTVKKMASEHRKMLDKIVEPLTKMSEELSVAHKKVSYMRDKVQAQANDVDEEINKYYDKLLKRLLLQRDELKKELHEVSRQKKKQFTVKLERIEHTQARLESINELSNAIQNGSDQELLLIEKQVVDGVKRICDSYSKLDPQLVQLAAMEFIPVEDYKKTMPQFGNLCHVCPQSCEIHCPKWSIEGSVVNIKLHAKDHFNQCCHKGGSKIIILMQPSEKDVVSVDVKDNEDGSYSASFVANRVGDMKLSVTVKGQQIKGSPFNVKVHRKYTTIDKPIKVVNADGNMGPPSGIAFSGDGMWAVADDTNHCVWIFDNNDKLVRKFGGKGTGNGKFDTPLGLVFYTNNDLYVTDQCNHRVEKFDINGLYLYQFGTQGLDKGQLQHPVGIIAHNSKLYIAESSNHRISVFRLDGQFSHIIGSSQLSKPRYIAINGSNQLLVADSGHHCISIFAVNGDYVGKVGTKDNIRIQLKSPTGITTDIHGFIFVTEGGNNRVTIFDKGGTFLYSFGIEGSSHGQFSLPYGIAISPTGVIYICDSRNKRIQIFST